MRTIEERRGIERRRPRQWRLPLIPLAAALVLGALWAFFPAIEGYHLGCSIAAGDATCLTHAGLLWGR